MKKSVAEKIEASFGECPSYAINDDEVKLAAGWLIDQSGLKGYRVGGAAVHEKQALVLVNLGGATAADVVTLAQHVLIRFTDDMASSLSMKCALWRKMQKHPWRHYASIRQHTTSGIDQISR